jgi:hypothetical protein
MQVLEIKPNSMNVVSVLLTCAYILAPEQGKQFHGHTIKIGFECKFVVVDIGLLEMECNHCWLG